MNGIVFRGQQAGFGNQSVPGGFMLNTLGEQIVMDWFQKAVMDGSCFHVRAGTLTTPLVGDVVITDTAAEMAIDAASGTTIIPIRVVVAQRLGTGTLFEHALKSVATVSSSGTAFVPLNNRSDGSAAVSTARVQAAGAVTVTAELATTTLRHWAYSQPIAQGAFNGPSDLPALLVPAPVLVGPRCCYLQVAATTTGPSYYASVDYIEYATTLVVL